MIEIVRTPTVIETETVGIEAVSQNETEAGNRPAQEIASEIAIEAEILTVEAGAAEIMIVKRAMIETEDIIKKRKTDITLEGKTL